MRKSILFIGAAVIVAGLAFVFWPHPEDVGRPNFFTDRTYNFEANRVLTDISVAGGDTGEAMQAITGIKAGDEQGWYNAWKAAGDRTTALANRTNDAIAKGNALLRAHTYYRTAEFFLNPHDPLRKDIWKRNVDSFDEGLRALGVAHERFAIPYGSHHLNAIYYPGPAGSEKRPLLMVVSGYDGTMEELYLSTVAAAMQRGYSVLTYEGPGQGSVIREQGLTFQPDWEKPTGAVLDKYLESHAKPNKIVLVGESLGGYLAPRAAAFDSRIDGVVAYDVFFDAYANAARNVPHFAFWLHDHGYDDLLNKLGTRHSDSGGKWAVQNGEWVFGVSTPFAVLDAFKPYNLSGVADKIKGDVLILAGADDHFVIPGQLEAFQKSLTNAHSVSAVTFDRISGAGEHCQIGAPSVWQGVFFDWLNAKFPAS